MRRTLQLGRAAVLLVALALAGVGVHFLHAYQVARNAGVLLDQADQARQDADKAKNAGDAVKTNDSLAKAADYLSRYLGFHPDDAGAVAKLGLVLEEQARSPSQKQRAFLVLDKAVRLDPGRADVRRRLADLAVAIGRTLDAREHLNYLLNSSCPNDPELEYLLGCSEETDAHFPEAKAAYEKAIHARPPASGDLCPSGVAAPPARRPNRRRRRRRQEPQRRRRRDALRDPPRRHGRHGEGFRPALRRGPAGPQPLPARGRPVLGRRPGRGRRPGDGAGGSGGASCLRRAEAG